MANKQAQAAGNKADEIIKNLATPAQAIETGQGTVEVLDTAQPAPEVGQSAQEPTDDGNWENRFKGYKASTDKTLHSLRQKASEFDLMTEENDRLKKQLEETQAKIPTTPDEMLELFTQEEVDGFNKMLDGRVGGLQDEVVRLQDELQGVREKEVAAEKQDTHKYVIDAVKKAVPDYTEIDSNPKFSEYMQGVDMFGNSRYDLFVRAKNSTPPDISRLVQFYVEFANEALTSASAQEESQKQYTQQELNQTPATTPSARVETPQGKGIVWDQATVSQLYKDKATGKISPALFKELEEDMYASRR